MISLFYETSFDDINPPNEASLTVIGSADNVGAASHNVRLRCATLNGTVTKDDAAINMTGIPNP